MQVRLVYAHIEEEELPRNGTKRYVKSAGRVYSAEIQNTTSFWKLGIVKFWFCFSAL